METDNDSWYKSWYCIKMWKSEGNKNTLFGVYLYVILVLGIIFIRYNENQAQTCEQY